MIAVGTHVKLGDPGEACPKKWSKPICGEGELVPIEDWEIAGHEQKADDDWEYVLEAWVEPQMSYDCAWGNGPLPKPYRVTYRVTA